MDGLRETALSDDKLQEASKRSREGSGELVLTNLFVSAQEALIETLEQQKTVLLRQIDALVGQVSL